MLFLYLVYLMDFDKVRTHQYCAAAHSGPGKDVHEVLSGSMLDVLHIKGNSE